MNIFYTDICPVKCAQNLDDKRVVKMALETAQLLSTAIHVRGGSATYKPTHVNHPCSVWARECVGNFTWAYEHFEALLAEYTHRYSKTHACAKLTREINDGRYLVRAGAMTRPAICTPGVDRGTTIDSYREYMRVKWASDKRTPMWTNRNNPDWS